MKMGIVMSEYIEEDNYEVSPIEINGYLFNMTCMACPEQYDVYKNGKQVAYVRLRWGHLRVDAPDVGGESIYYYEFKDGLQGCFDSEEERMYHLTEIARIIGERCAEAQGGHC
jgi:hypothetical protein